MNKRILTAWIIEFGSVTAITVILATTAKNGWISVPIAVIIAAKVSEYVFASLERRRERHNVVRRQLQVFLALLPSDGTDVRCTYHYPVRHRIGGRVELVQAFDYLPQGGGGGRSFSTEQGIIGKAYDTKGPRVENFSSDEEFRQRMIEEYNYSTGELGERRTDRRSYACWPIVDETHTVLGLIYVDADLQGVFTDDMKNPRWRGLNAAGAVIREALLE